MHVFFGQFTIKVPIIIANYALQPSHKSPFSNTSHSQSRQPTIAIMSLPVIILWKHTHTCTVPIKHIQMLNYIPLLFCQTTNLAHFKQAVHSSRSKQSRI